MQWVIESLGNDRYKSSNKKSGMGLALPSGENNVVETVVEGPTEWIIKPTDIEGEYMYGFNHGDDGPDVLISEQSLQRVFHQ